LKSVGLTISSFSHHRITIPPVNFTNACHRNNILSLGTFIVEWQEGISELEKFLLGKSTDTEFDKDQASKDVWNPYYADILGKLPNYCKLNHTQSLFLIQGFQLILRISINLMDGSLT
jgi:hypothetical protein